MREESESGIRIHEQDRQGYKALTADLETKYKSRKKQYCETGNQFSYVNNLLHTQKAYSERL